MSTQTQPVTKSNVSAFLTTIAVSEGTEHLGDHGYNAVVGGTLFGGYGDHPRKRVWIGRINTFSTAAGRYQILARIYDYYKREMDLPDFSPLSQDKIALRLISECGALDDVMAGHFGSAIEKCRSRWASLPGAGYGQHENTLAKLTGAFLEAGGVVA